MYAQLWRARFAAWMREACGINIEGVLGSARSIPISTGTPVSVHLSARPGEKVTFKDQALSQDQDTSRFQFIRSREIRLRLGHPTLPSSAFPPASMPRGTPAETPPLTGFPVSGGKPVPLSQLLVTPAPAKSPGSTGA